MSGVASSPGRYEGDHREQAATSATDRGRPAAVLLDQDVLSPDPRVRNRRVRAVEAGMSDLVIVSNRLPVRRDGDGWATSPGGLVTAMGPVTASRDSSWIGWAGEVDTDLGPFRHDQWALRPIPLSAKETERYYEGFANTTIWPLYHTAIRTPTFSRIWWQAYQAVNERFADAAAEAAAPGGTVWVHDYHLQLVPELVRERRPDVRVGFFLHTPFPPSELMRRLPWRRQIVEGMLGADIVGFQTSADARHFLYLAHHLELLPDEPTFSTDRSVTIDWAGRQVQVGAYPISIDVAAMDELAGSASVVEESRRLRKRLGDPDVLLLGVDRLDYTKGIDARLKAFGELLDEGRLDPAKVRMLQVATPSREDVKGYEETRDRVEQLVGKINGAHSTMGQTVVHYLHQTFPIEELAAMYRASDVMVVTPFRDGMNLVAKEYVTCRQDGTGVLLLSEFAGSADELSEALLCNPYDVEDLKAQLMRAVELPEAEVRSRMARLRAVVEGNTVHDWAAAFLGELS